MALVIGSTATVYADSDGRGLNCVLALAVVDPGADSVHGKVVTNTGQVTAGELDCNIDALDGAIFTEHGSRVTVSRNGRFEGKLEGQFSLQTATGVEYGEIRASVTGAMATPGDAATVYTETINGQWELQSGIRGRGRFNITLEPYPADDPITLAGVGTLKGRVDLDDRNSRRGDDDDDDGDDDDD